MEKKLIITKRKKAKFLYEEKGWSIRKIAKYLIACKDNVSRWIHMRDEELYSDNRGWKKGVLRQNSIQTKERIKTIREQLIKEKSYFYGAKIIRQNYESLYGEKVSLWFVNNTLKEYGMVKSPQPYRPGKSKYMHYPVHTLNKLCKTLMSIDFIGPKYLKDSDKRINFLSCKYIRPNKEGIVERVSGQTGVESIRVLKKIWREHPLPDVLKVDNDSAFGTNLSHDLCVGKTTLFLLNLGVKPLYVAPRSPWNNGEVEGFNSIFSKKFWKAINFTDEDEIDIEIKNFNMEYSKYSKFINNNVSIKDPVFINDLEHIDIKNNQVNKFKTDKIYFLRIVRRLGEKGEENEKGFIELLGVKIIIPQDLINLFVFCELKIKAQKLIISTENESGQLLKIKEQKMKLKNIIYKE
jgi:hypothetical protein